jgi:hypothetical protein
LEAFLEFFSDRDIFTVYHFADRELVEEFLLGHRVVVFHTLRKKCPSLLRWIVVGIQITRTKTQEINKNNKTQNLRNKNVEPLLTGTR